MFKLPNAGRLQGTPVVADGVMYVTDANECAALDAGNGRQIWRYQRPRSTGLAGDAASGINRGVALGGDKVFMVTDNAHLIALDRATGLLLWDVEMADWRQNHGATSAPLAVGNLVISGTGGGDNGAQGFVAAFDQATGKEVWRFSTLPKPGEPAWDTWKGKSIEHGGANTWFTGTYDPETGTLFWPTGNPGPDYNGDERGGDNLYSDCILALDLATGKLKWYYQFTPHDLWDWDATETPMVINANWQGQPRKLLVQANRNGFFYVFDRTDGTLLLAKQFIKNLTWASGIGADGKPIKTAESGADRGGHARVPFAGWRDELVFSLLQSGNRVVLRPGIREVLDLHQAAGRVGAGKGIRRRKSARRYKSKTAAMAVRSRPADRQPAMGTAASRPRLHVGWNACHVNRTGFLRRRQRNVRRRRCCDRQDAVVIPGQRQLACIADDVSIRRATIQLPSPRAETFSRSDSSNRKRRHVEANVRVRIRGRCRSRAFLHAAPHAQPGCTATVQQPSPPAPAGGQGELFAPPPMPEILKQYQPISADRLKTPADGDWPMIRRTYDGWGYSPLSQIDTGNVKRLEPVWGFLNRRHEWT